MLTGATERFLAWRYIRARSGDGFISLTSWLAVIGMVLGVATLILVTSLMNGIQTEMRNQLLGVGGHISVSGAGGIALYDELGVYLSSIPGVKSATPKIDGQVMLSAHGVARGAQVMAVPMGQGALVEGGLFDKHMVSGKMWEGLFNGGLLIGEGIANAMGLKVGDTLTIISPNGQATIAGMVPRIKAYPIGGIFKLGMHAYDSSLVVMPFEAAETFFRMRNAGNDPLVSQIEVMLNDSDDAAALVPVIAKGLSPSARVEDWQSTNAGVFAALTIQRNVMVIILTLIVLVAAFNIVACLVMLVKEKRGDIGILRTLGATRGAILRIFIYAGFVLGLIGSVIGVVLGMLLARYIESVRIFFEKLTGQSLLPENIYFLSTLPTKTDPSQVITIVIFAFLLSLLATLYPAFKAARLKPVEALKHE